MLAATTFDAAARDLFQLAKSRRKGVSLAAICERIGVKSRGHLSEVFAGRRRLDARKVPLLASALGLTGMAREYFVLMHDESDAEALVERRNLLRRVLGAEEPEVPARLGEMFLAFKVFAAFALFRDRPTRNQLVDFFGKANCQDVDQSLALLAEAGLISLDGAHLKPHFERVIFRNDGSGLSLRSYLHTSLADAQRSLGRWLDDRERAIYQSSIISVSKSALIKVLPEIKARLREEQARLESADPDMLVHFNVQIYPVENEGSHSDS